MNNLPNGAKELKATYDDALRRIDAQGQERRQLARHVLSWIVYSKRTLTITELLDVLSIAYDPEAPEFDEDMRPDVQDVDSLCAGLVSIDTNARHVRLVHETTLEYFTRSHPIHGAHGEILKVCFRILSYPKSLHDYTTRFCDSAKHHTGVSTSLFRYAGLFWYTHALEANDAWEEVFRFLLNSVAVSVCMRQRKGQRWSSNASGLGIHLAASLGLDELASRLIESGQAFDAIDSNGSTPLLYASVSGSLETVQLLLSSHLQSALEDSRAYEDDLEDSHHWNPRKQILLEVYLALKQATLAGHSSVVQKLIAVTGLEQFVREKTFPRLDDDDDVADYGSRLEDPIYWAISKGHFGIFRLLTSAWGSWYDRTFPKWAEESLAHAFTGGSTSILELLIEWRNQYPSIQKALHNLSEETNAHSTDMPFMRRLPESKVASMLQILANYFLSSEFWERSDTGLNFFYKILDTARLELIKQFTERVTNHPHFTPASPRLLRAILDCRKRSHGEEISSFLIATFKIDPHAIVSSRPGYSNASLLFMSIVEENLELFHQLLATLDLSAGSTDNWRVLFAAMVAGSSLERGAMHWLREIPDNRDGMKIVIDVLNEKYGNSLNCRDEHGNTPLILAMYYGHNYVESLHDRKAIYVNVQNNNGVTALMYACYCYGRIFYERSTNCKRHSRDTHDSMLLDLLNIPELDVTIEDNDGNTALWWAIHGLEDQVIIVLSAVGDPKLEEISWSLLSRLKHQESAINTLLYVGKVTPDPKAMQFVADKLQHYRNEQGNAGNLCEFDRLDLIESYERVQTAMLRHLRKSKNE